MEVEREYWFKRERGNRLFWGVALIALGLLATFDYLGVLPWRLGSTTWPVVVIVLGLARTVTAYSAKKLGSGVSITLLGVWFWAATNGWHGFNWANSWPLALVSTGAGMVAHVLAAPFYRRNVEVREVDHDVR